MWPENVNLHGCPFLTCFFPTEAFNVALIFTQYTFEIETEATCIEWWFEPKPIFWSLSTIICHFPDMLNRVLKYFTQIPWFNLLNLYYTNMTPSQWPLFRLSLEHLLSSPLGGKKKSSESLHPARWKGFTGSGLVWVVGSICSWPVDVTSHVAAIFPPTLWKQVNGSQAGGKYATLHLMAMRLM